MKILNKIISLLMIILVFMITISTFVSAATLDNSTSLEQNSTDKQLKLIPKELNSVIDSGLLTLPTILDTNCRLEYGSKGEQVRLLQKELNSVMNAGLTVDGSFGSKTKNAVMDFQKKYNLEVDGIVGVKTATKLNEAYLAINNCEIVINDTLDVRCHLEYGSKGEQVKLLQKELNSVMNAGLTVDGSFGSKTKNAVMDFQKKYNLEVDGIVGIATAGQLNVAYSANTNYVIVNDTDLNVRTEPSANSTKLGTIYMGDAYATYGTATASNGRTWYKIKYNGQDAYISASYVTQNGIFLDLSEQILKVYKDGKLQLESPVITGNNGNNGTVAHKTPTGKYLFYKSNKQTDRVLRGYNDDGSRYASHVDYWMPFITSRGIGFHDATWRSNSQFYNKNTYLTNGSHACVNMPHACAKQLYNLITSNIYVYVFN